MINIATTVPIMVDFMWEFEEEGDKNEWHIQIALKILSSDICEDFKDDAISVLLRAKTFCKTTRLKMRDFLVDEKNEALFEILPEAVLQIVAENAYAI